MIETRQIEFETKGENDILNITDDVQKLVRGSKARNGTVFLFLQSTTASLTIIEYEDGLLTDFPKMMERIAPKNASYEHEKAWHDGNGHSHIRSSVVGTNLFIPFKDKKLLLGTWQQIVLAEFDVRPRRRSLIVQMQS